MRPGLLIPLIFLILAVSCSQKKICPAYQSSFIYDKEALKKNFSYFDEDANPRVFASASKNKYLVAVPESYRKKYQRLQTIEMKMVYPSEPDSLALLSLLPEELPGDSVAVSDSLQSVISRDESGMVQKSLDFKITKTREKYNNDQDYYMWFFRRALILPDIRYHMEKNQQPTEVRETSRQGKENKPVDAPKKSFLKRPSQKPTISADTITGPSGKN